MAKRTGLGRGIGALIPTSSETRERPADVFFAGSAAAEVSEKVAEQTPATKAPAEKKPATRRSSTTTAAKKATASEQKDAAKKPAPGKAATTTSAEKPASKSAGAKAPARAKATAPAKPSPAPAEPDDAPQLAEVPGVRLVHVDPHTIVPNPRQPRTQFDPAELAELVHSVREFGVLQPVVVRDKHDGTYELIMGERRTRASREAGLARIPAIIRDTADEDLLRDALLENIHRAQLNPLEEASAYQQLIEDFGITQEQLAERIGRSRPQISNTIRLLRLPETVQQRVAAGVLSAGHARAVLVLDGDIEGMQKLADKIVNEELSVRGAESAARALADAGSVEPKKSPTPKQGARRAYLDDVAERLGDRLDTKVKISLTARKGQVSIDFASIQDLNRILDELGETGYAS